MYKNLNKNTATILEIETPIDKDDLVRFKDNYGREKQPYEDKKSMADLEKYLSIWWTYFKFINEYCVDGVNININKTNDVNQLLELESTSIIAVLDGGFESDDNQLVLSPGDIVGLETIKNFEVFTKIY